MGHIRSGGNNSVHDRSDQMLALFSPFAGWANMPNRDGTPRKRQGSLHANVPATTSHNETPTIRLNTRCAPGAARASFGLLNKQFEPSRRFG